MRNVQIGLVTIFVALTLAACGEDPKPAPNPGGGGGGGGLGGSGSTTTAPAPAAPVAPPVASAPGVPVPSAPAPAPSPELPRDLTGACLIDEANACNEYEFSGDGALASQAQKNFKAACTGRWASVCPKPVVGGCDMGVIARDAKLSVSLTFWLYNRSLDEARQFCELTGKPFITR